jgi:hypothetical protein
MGKGPQYSLDRRMGEEGTKTGLGDTEKKKVFTLPGLEP